MSQNVVVLAIKQSNWNFEFWTKLRNSVVRRYSKKRCVISGYNNKNKQRKDPTVILFLTSHSFLYLSRGVWKAGSKFSFPCFVLNRFWVKILLTLKKWVCVNLVKKCSDWIWRRCSAPLACILRNIPACRLGIVVMHNQIASLFRGLFWWYASNMILCM